MKIGFFADDDSACRAAFLADKAFDWNDDASSSSLSYLAGGGCIAEAVPDYLDAASSKERTCSWRCRSGAWTTSQYEAAWT